MSVERIPIESRELFRYCVPVSAVDKARFERLFTVEPATSCWLWVGATARFGYGSFRFAGAARVAHRFSWMLYRGNIPDKLFVLHKCDVPACVNPDHLFLGTQVDNQADAAKKGRRAWVKGERQANAKLSEEQAYAIIADTRPQRVIAAAFGISKGNVANIKTGAAWRHLKRDGIHVR